MVAEPPQVSRGGRGPCWKKFTGWLVRHRAICPGTEVRLVSPESPHTDEPYTGPRGNIYPLKGPTNKVTWIIRVGTGVGSKVYTSPATWAKAIYGNTPKTETRGGNLGNYGWSDLMIRLTDQGYHRGSILRDRLSQGLLPPSRDLPSEIPPLSKAPGTPEVSIPRVSVEAVVLNRIRETGDEANLVRFMTSSRNSSLPLRRKTPPNSDGLSEVTRRKNYYKRQCYRLETEARRLGGLVSEKDTRIKELEHALRTTTAAGESLFNGPPEGEEEETEMKGNFLFSRVGTTPEYILPGFLRSTVPPLLAMSEDEKGWGQTGSPSVHVPLSITWDVGSTSGELPLDLTTI